MISIYFYNEMRRRTWTNSNGCTIYKPAYDLKGVNLYQFERAGCKTCPENGAHRFSSFFQVAPPSVVLYRPRSSFGP